MNPTPKIFISYRRDDGSHSERLWDHAVRWFGEANVFFDRDRASIKPANEFPHALEAGVQKAEIFLVVIGPNWLNEENLLRLKDEDDYVRRELEQALGRRKTGENLEVLPLLVGGASMPSRDALPPELAGLADIQALRLHEGTAEYLHDIEALVRLINIHCPGLRARRQNKWVRGGLLSSDQSIAHFYQDIAVRAPERQPINRLAASSALNEWWSNWAERRQAFVLLGEEGDGKSWATAEWLAGKLDEPDFVVPIVFAPALHMASASISEILAACLEQSQPTPSKNWPTRLLDLASQPPSAMPLFLLVVDAFNERTQLDWRELFDTVRASPWRERIALLALCRSPYWDHLGVPDDGLFTSWTLPPFNDTELNQALAQRGSTRSEFNAEVLHLMARPRYFDLAFRLHGEIEQGGLTLERLIYEDWRDMTGRKRQQHCSQDDFQSLIADLAKQYESRRFAIPEFSQQAQGITDDIATLRKELVSVRILDSKKGKLAIDPRYLPLGLGLVLAREVEECTENDSSALAETIAKRMGSYREADLQVRICSMALFHALNTKDYPEVGCLALLHAWIEGRNLDDGDLEKIAAYLPLRPKTYLHMAEYIWGEADNRAAQDAFMAGFLRHRKLPGVKSELVPTFTHWLGFVYPWGFSAYFEQDAEKLTEARQAVEQRLGQEAKPGSVELLGVELQVVHNAGLLRLAQVALAVLSHDHASAYADALLTGIVASAVMDGSQAEFPWVLHTCRPETRQALLLAARRLLAADKPTAYLAARKLLAYLGNEEARGLLEQIPLEFSFVNHFAELRKEDPCSSIFGPWKKDNYLDCLQRNCDHPSFIARQLKKLALDPNINVPPELCSKLSEAGNGMDLTKIGCFMAATIEQHYLEEMEPALCAFAANRYRDLMRSLARDMAARDGLARRQLAWHFLDHAPILGNEEREIILTAWRSTLDTQDEHNRVAEFTLFPIVLFDLPAVEQWQLLTERGEANGYFTQHAPSFRPLSPEHGSAILSALKMLDPGSPQRLYNRLWYLSNTLRHPDKEIRDHLLARFGEFDSVARGYCIEIFINSGDTEAAQQVIAAGWHTRSGRDNFMENSRGSILLAEFGKELPFDDLASRVSPEWLGYAVKKRGYRPDEVATYTQLLDATWRHIGARTLTEEAESLSRYVLLKVNPAEEKQADSLSIAKTGPDNIRFTNYTWGGSAGAGSIDDLMVSTDPEAQIERSNALAKQVASLAEKECDNGNPWFAHAFRDGGLAEVLAQDDTLWRSWLEPVLRDDRRAWQLLTLCRGFYEKLCAALLAHAQENGLALFKVIASHPTIRITDARLGLPVLLMDAFAALASPQVEQLLRDQIDNGTTDIDLFESTLLCQLGGKSGWMQQLVSELLSSDHDYERARGIALLGFSDAEAEGARLANWIANNPDCWVRDVAEIAQQNHRRNTWARCWFDRFLSRDDRIEAWAAFRLFLRCVDRRFWLWIDHSGLADAEPWKRDAVAMNMGTIESACKENEKAWKDCFLGQKTKPDELWPWMKDYQWHTVTAVYLA